MTKDLVSKFNCTTPWMLDFARNKSPPNICWYIYYVFKNFAIIRKVFGEKEYTICGPDLSTEAASYYMDHRYAYYDTCAVPCKVDTLVTLTPAS